MIYRWISQILPWSTDEFRDFVSHPIDEFRNIFEISPWINRWFSRYFVVTNRQISEFFSSRLIAEFFWQSTVVFCIFLPDTDWWILRYFMSTDWKFCDFFLRLISENCSFFFTRDRRISHLFSQPAENFYNLLGNFEIFKCERLMNFAIFVHERLKNFAFFFQMLGWRISPFFPTTGWRI